MSTQIRGSQIRLATLSRGHMDAAFAAELAAIESNITSIFDTMSTDQERLDAINAVTAAWAAGDATLQGTIEAMVNATRNGAGLEADGSYVPGVSNYLDGTTSLKQAIAALDAAMATVTSANAAAISAETAAREAAVAQEVIDRDAAIAVETAARVAADATLQANIDALDAAHMASMAQTDIDLANEVTARTNSDAVLQQSVADEAAARAAADSAEATARSAADVVLQSNIDAEALARTEADAVHTAAIAQEVSDRVAAVGAEEAARIAGDTALSSRLDAVEGNLGSEAMTFARYINRETPVGAVDGVNALFQLEFPQVAGTENVFLNGMLMEPGAGNDYTIDAQGAITLNAAPLVGDRVKVTYFR